MLQTLGHWPFAQRRQGMYPTLLATANTAQPIPPPWGSGYANYKTFAQRRRSWPCPIINNNIAKPGFIGSTTPPQQPTLLTVLVDFYPWVDNGSLLYLLAGVSEEGELVGHCALNPVI